MKQQKNLVIHLVSLSLLTASTLVSHISQAREQIRIVGSSTVYPFSSAVAEEFGATTDYPTPVVESTGSGGGFKLFCKGNEMNTPDITNASRRMKVKEFQLCAQNGVRDITEAIIGYDGIVIAQDKSNPPLKLTKKHLLLAVAAEVPDKTGSKLIKNPYTKWSEIDPALPDREIIIYGPPTSSGTRDAFEDMIMKSQTRKMPVYTQKYQKYRKIRQDNAYLPSGENDNLIVKKISKNKKAIGIFGYSFLVENEDKIAAAYINGVLPNPETIASGAYPVSRSLFFYVKNAHRQALPAINDYVDLFMSESMIGVDGILSEIGLIPLAEEQRKAARDSVLKWQKLTEADLH